MKINEGQKERISQDYEFHNKKFDELTVCELYDILQLRTLVFVVEQECIYQDLDDKDKQSIFLWITSEAGEVLAHARVLPKGISYDGYVSIGRVVSHKSFRGLGLGKKIMQYSIQYCETFFNNESIKISAQSYLKNFYESLGFHQVSEPYMEDGIPHIAMIRSSE